MAVLTTLVGASTVAIIMPHLNRWEGNELVGYSDIAGYATRCMGVREGAVVGKKYTPAECEEVNAKAVLVHAREVLACSPELKGHPAQLAMAISAAFNMGGPRYCGSSMARLFKAGDWQGACKAFLLYDGATYPAPQPNMQCRRLRPGKWVCKIRGLTNRRTDEVAKCRNGLIQ